MTARARSASARRRAALALGAAFALTLTANAGATPLGRDGDPIRTSRYSVDLTQTPVLAGSRVTGLAGAYVAIAEGIDGDVQNPAAPAVRVPYSTDHFEFELGLGLTLPATLTSTDFFNTGRERTELGNTHQQGFVFVTPALNLVWGDFGLGATLELQNYSLARTDVTAQNGRQEELTADFAVLHLQAAHRFDHGNIVAGVGLRVLRLDVTNPSAANGQTALFTTSGLGVELGALWMPNDLPFRIGASFRSGVSTNPDPNSRVTADAEGDRVVNPNDPANTIFLPDRVDQPWDLNVGFAVQVGPRAFNPRWIDPKDRDSEIERALQRRTAEREYRRALELDQLRAEGKLDPAARRAVDAEFDNDQAIDELHLTHSQDTTQERLKARYRQYPRRYVLLAASLVVTGSLTDAVGVESFLERTVARSGAQLGFSPRFGVETEIVPEWVKVRGGTYGEPTRFATSSGRLHGTFGFDAKLFPWTVFGLFDDETAWRVSASLDVATRYFGWGVGIGVWH